jgi:hypothetical protein
VVIDQTHSSAYTINALIDAYLASSDFTKRPASTRDQYRRYLQMPSSRSMC